MNIIVVKQKDIPQLMEYQFKLFLNWDSIDEADKLDITWFKSNEHKKNLTKNIKDKNKRFFIIQHNNHIIGYLKAEIITREPFLKKVGYISEIYITPEYRGKDFGTLLVNSSLNWFRRHKLLWTTVSTHVSDRNANLFWKKKGYKEFNKTFKMKL